MGSPIRVLMAQEAEERTRFLPLDKPGELTADERDTLWAAEQIFTKISDGKAG